MHFVQLDLEYKISYSVSSPSISTGAFVAGLGERFFVDRQSGYVNTDSNTITVWSDIGCPWATLALHTLKSVAHARGDDILIDHRAFPLELFNSRPTPKPILDAEVVAIAGLRPELSWRLWDQPDGMYPVTTLPALEAVQAAKSKVVGGLRASDELDEALRKAFYSEARCISMHSVILDVAMCCPSVNVGKLEKLLIKGAARAEIHRQYQIAQNQPSIQGSPHLFIASGLNQHNPGVRYHWTAEPGKGFPRFDSYDDGWANQLIDKLGEAVSEH